MQIPRPWSQATPPRRFRTAKECEDWIRDEVAQFAMTLGAFQYQERRGRELTVKEYDAVGFVAGFTGSLITYAMASEAIAPLLRRIRSYAIVLSLSLVWLILATIYGWYVGNAASLRTFSITFVPAMLAIALTTAKIWKTWAEATKARAEAEKLRREMERGIQ